MSNSRPRRIRVRVETEISSGPANKLCEHELSIIFDHPCIGFQDLLSYRLVNKNWRDAATRALLSRNKCYVSVSLDGRDHKSKKKQFYRSPFKTRILHLEDLTHLMSTSPKFPTTTFHLKGQDFRYDVSIRDGKCLDYAAFPDLKHFFQCHGDKIKTLRLKGCVWKKNLVDLLFTHTPNLNCLDLRKAVLLPYPDMWAYNRKNSDCPGPYKDAWIPPADISWPSEKNVTQLPLKTVHFGFEIHEAQAHVTEFLFSALSNAKCLEDVNCDALPDILKLGKGHLVKSFELVLLGPFQDGVVSAVETFAEMKPALTKIGFKSWSLNMDENEKATMAALAATINPLIESSKGSIKSLEVHTDHEFALHTQLCISSPMQNLTSLKFSESKRYRRDNGGRTYSEKNKKVEEVFVYPENSSMKQYFPHLTKLELKVEYIERAATRLFNFVGAGAGRSRKGEDSIPTVETLKISTNWPINTADSKYISRKFPNVRILTISFNTRWDWNCSLWALCPLAESVTIQHIDNVDVEAADSFFTGFSLETCAKLRASCIQETGSGSASSSSSSSFMRCQEGLGPKTRSQSRSPQPVQREPAMTDLSGLKLLKLEFMRLDSLFVSEVTGIYAFQKMPGTKIIVSIDPYLLSFCDAQKENKEVHLAPIAQYVHVVHEES